MDNGHQHAGGGISVTGLMEVQIGFPTRKQKSKFFLRSLPGLEVSFAPDSRAQLMPFTVLCTGSSWQIHCCGLVKLLQITKSKMHPFLASSLHWILPPLNVGQLLLIPVAGLLPSPPCSGGLVFQVSWETETGDQPTQFAGLNPFSPHGEAGM